MSSLMGPPILDAAAQAAISKARSELGVHFYADTPHTKANSVTHTALYSIEATKSTSLTWTVLVRATGDKSQFFVHLGDGRGKNDMVMGIVGKITNYIQDSGSWKNITSGLGSIKWKKGQYVVLTTHFKYPKGTTVEPVRFALNGEELKDTLLFENATDFSKFGYVFGLDKNPVETEIVEQHLLYSGITQGLPPRATPGDPISFRDCQLCHLSIGGRAVIEGWYVNSNSKYTGIMIGVATKKRSFPEDFASQKDPKELVTFAISVGFRDVVISNEREEKMVHITINYDEYIWLIVDNIYILNMEIHRGTSTIEPDNK